MSLLSGSLSLVPKLLLGTHSLKLRFRPYS
jgi:hypothetical protein